MRRRQRSGREHARADGLNRVTMERAFSGEQFIEDATERKEIGAGVLRPAHNLFGAPVSRSAEQGRANAVAMSDACHAKVGEFHAAFGVDENVCGFDVSVNDALAMRDAECNGDVAHPGAGARKRNRTPFEDAIKRLPVHEFHDKVGSLCGFVNAHVMQREDAGMIDLADDASFLKEFFARFAFGDFSRENLNGDDTADVGIVRTDDAAKGASADGVENFVATNFHVKTNFREARGHSASEG